MTIGSTCRTHFPVLSSFMTYHRICNKINMTRAANGVGFQWGSCYSIFSFMCMFCRSQLDLLYFFFWPLCCLSFFDLLLLATPLVSSNYSYASVMSRFGRAFLHIVRTEMFGSFMFQSYFNHTFLDSSNIHTFFAILNSDLVFSLFTENIFPQHLYIIRSSVLKKDNSFKNKKRGVIFSLSKNSELFIQTVMLTILSKSITF